MLKKMQEQKAVFTDEEYMQSGANILDSASLVYAKSKMIVKVKEPQKSEYDFFAGFSNSFYLFASCPFKRAD